MRQTDWPAWKKAAPARPRPPPIPFFEALRPETFKCGYQRMKLLFQVLIGPLRRRVAVLESAEGKATLASSQLISIGKMAVRPFL